MMMENFGKYLTTCGFHENKWLSLILEMIKKPLISMSNLVLWLLKYSNLTIWTNICS